MHTTKTENILFIHDGDYKADIMIVSGEKRLTVPSEDMKAFMASWVRHKKINRLHEATDDEVLGLSP